jgi:hypothetical protein
MVPLRMMVRDMSSYGSRQRMRMTASERAYVQVIGNTHSQSGPLNEDEAKAAASRARQAAYAEEHAARYAKRRKGGRPWSF